MKLYDGSLHRGLKGKKRESVHSAAATKQENLRAIEEAVKIQSHVMRRGSAADLEAHLGKQEASLSSLRDGPWLQNAKQTLQLTRDLYTEESHKIIPSDGDARELLHTKNLLFLGDAVPQAPAAKFIQALRASASIGGIFLAVGERVGSPTALALVAFAGLDTVSNNSQMRWSYGGSAIALAGVALGLQAVPEKFKLGPWQESIKIKTSMKSVADSIIVKQATEHMVASYAAGINGAVGIGLAFKLAKSNTIAVTTTGAIFAAAFLVAGRAALPTGEKGASRLSSSLGVIATFIGVSLLLARPEISENEETGSPPGKVAAFQATVGFPTAIGLLGVASFLQNFSSEREALKRTRKVINTVLLEKSLTALEKDIANAEGHAALQEEKELEIQLESARAMLAAIEAQWSLVETKERALSQLLMSMRDKTREELSTILTETRDTPE